MAADAQATPGQAAYEAHSAMVVPRPWRWNQLDDKLRAAWEEAAQAAIVAGMAPGFAAHSLAARDRDRLAAECELLRQQLAEARAELESAGRGGIAIIADRDRYRAALEEIHSRGRDGYVIARVLWNIADSALGGGSVAAAISGEAPDAS